MMFRGRGMLRGGVVTLLFLTCCAHALAADLTPENEYKKLIRVEDKVQPLGAHPFGASIGLYDGGLSFRETDVSLSGTGPALELTRSFHIRGKDYHVGRPDLAFGDWDLDLPRITTVTANQSPVTGWDVGTAGNTNRCTDFRPPPTVPAPRGDSQSADWEPRTWWHGYHLIVPGDGDQTLLYRNSSNPHSPLMSGMTFNIVTKNDWMISCLSSTANNQPGEGFLAVAPDGTKYWFNELVYRWAPTLTRPLDSGPLSQSTSFPDQLRSLFASRKNFVPGLLGLLTGSNPAHAAPSEDFLNRRQASMLVTKIEDRFGNTLNYSYNSNGYLTAIRASDGRELTVQYVSGSNRIQSVTLQPSDGAPRTWTYGYTGSDAYSMQLTTVTEPDGSQWHFNMGAFSEDAWLYVTTAGTCSTPGTPDLVDSSWTGSITHPSGLTATFTVKPIEHTRSYVPKTCWGSPNPSDPELGYALIPRAWYSFTLTQRTLSGAGVPTQTWKYGYSAPNASWANDSCASTGSCTSTVWTDVTDPEGHAVRHTFSNRFDITEGQQQRTDYYSGATGTTVLRSESDSYADPTAGPWPSSYGNYLQSRFNQAQVTEQAPLDQRVITQDGDSYTWKAETFNSYAQVTKEKRSNSIYPQSIETQTTYRNDPALWVLGLTTQVDNLSTGAIVDSYTYDSSNDTLLTRNHFGQKVMDYAFNSAGELTSFTDADGHTTTLSGYTRGIPTSIGYPDHTSQSLAADAFGDITAVTDQSGASTHYSYDAVGRLTRIDYPADSPARNAKTFTYSFVTAAERGIGTDHWDRTVSQGNERQTTYYSATLRPLLSDTSISTDGSSHVTQGNTYDWRGLSTFQSYAVGGSPAWTALDSGTHTTYDALGRVVQSAQDSELGSLTSTTAYLSGARKQVTDPKGNVTTTSYQVFDQPSYDSVIKVQAPEGITQTITRDLYGDPTSITQSGGGTSLTKTLVYDGQQRLCRRTEPESNSTVMDYDAAGNLAWSATAQSITGNGCGQDQVATAAKVTRSYDAMNRLQSISYPDGYSSASFTYDARGDLATSSVPYSGAQWTYTHNAAGQPTSETLAIDGYTWPFTYAYDGNGDLASTSYPDGKTVSYAPDALGRPTQVRDAATTFASGATYFPTGQLQYLSYLGGTDYVAERNSRRILSNISYAQGSALLVSEDMSYDKDANLTHINDLVDGTRTKAFTYDALNRLTQATATNLWGTDTYGYDALNNLADLHENGADRTYHYTANRLTSITSGASTLHTFGYNNRGDTISKDGTQRYFGGASRLLQVVGKATYYYDASGHRVKTTAADGTKTYAVYGQAGKLMMQFHASTLDMDDYIHLGKRLIAKATSNSSSIVGNEDGVVFDGNGNASLKGWACSTGLTTSVSVELFAGGPSGGGGTRIGTYTANQSSEPAVASACGASGSHYRFLIPLTTAQRGTYTGQALYVYGDSPVGNSNNQLSGSGTSIMPALPNTAPILSAPSNSTNGSYTVSWNTVPQATSYVVQEQLNDGSWSQAYNGSGTSVALSGRGTGTYTYRADSCNGTDCTSWGGTIGVSVLLPPAAPGSISAPGSSSGSVAISWAAASTATSYTLQHQVNGGSWSTIYTGTALSRTQGEAATGTYTYRIQGCNSSGCSSFKTSAGVAVTIPPSSAPALSAPSSSSSGSYTVSWGTVSGASSYTLQEQTNGGGWGTIYTGGGTNKGISGKGNGAYGYRVRACNAGGCGGWAGTRTTSVLHPPPEPASISIPGTSNGPVGVSWAASNTATSYTLQHANSGVTGWSTVYSGAATSYTSHETTSGTWIYKVRACNSGGCSAYRASSGGVTVTIPPTTPSLSVPGSSTTGSYTVTWGAVSGATSYTLQQQTNGGGWSTLYSGSGRSKGVSGKGTGTYGYRVRACNAGGCSGWSGTKSISVLLPPATPAAPSLSVIPPDTKPTINATWSTVSTATEYQLQETAPSGSVYSVYDGSGTSWAQAQLSSGEYKFKLRACNSSGCSGWSAAASIYVMVSGKGFPGP